MNANWDACFAETEKWEGGYSDNPRDPGGATQHGLTQGVFNGYCAKQGIARRSVKFATKDEIASIFKLQYWDPVMGDELWAGLDMLMFDRAINEGPVRPIRDLQRIVGAVQDGQFGLETLGAVQARTDRSTVLNQLHLARLGFWRSLGRLWFWFGPGWSNRERDVYIVAQRMMFGAANGPAT